MEDPNFVPNCFLCGLPTDDYAPASNPDWEMEDWMLSHRIIFVVQGHWDVIHESEPRQQGLSDDLVPIKLPDFPEPIQVMPFCREFGLGGEGSDQPLYGFGVPVHCACWDLLKAFRPDGDLDLNALMRVCFSFPIDNYKIRSGLRYHGRTEFGTSSAAPGDNFPSPTFSCLVGLTDEPDPSRLDEGFLSGIDSHSSYTRADSLIEYAPPSKILSKPGTKDRFDSMPPEILHEIMSFLPCKDVANFRKASCVAAAVKLPEAFWRSRFFAGEEFEYLHEVRSELLSPPGESKWKNLYFWARYHNRRKVFRQRQRFWDLLSQFHCLIDLAGGRPCQGTPASGAFDSGDYDDGLYWLTAGHAILRPGELCPYGYSPALFERALTIPEKVDEIYVSTAWVQSRTHITGLRFVSDGMSFPVGYVGRTHEFGIDLSDIDQTRKGVVIRGFLLAQTSWGIRGIAVMTDSGVTRWIGEHYSQAENYCNQIPLRRLTFPPPALRWWADSDYDPVIQHIKCGFDGLKMVSLSVSDGSKPSSPDPGSMSTRRVDGCPLKNIRDDAMWSPSLPPVHLEISMQTEFGTGSRHIGNYPATWEAFGGLHGEKLVDVTGLKVWVNFATSDGPHYIHRLAVETSGGRTLDIGSDFSGLRWTREISFAIDGQNGERITGISNYYKQLGQGDEDDGNRFFGFSVHTSFGLTKMFPETIEDNVGSFRQIVPHTGTVVGFCAPWVVEGGQDHKRNRFSELGIVYLPDPSPQNFPDYGPEW